jgi:hypothetical protein
MDSNADLKHAEALLDQVQDASPPRSPERFVVDEVLIPCDSAVLGKTLAELNSASNSTSRWSASAEGRSASSPPALTSG